MCGIVGAVARRNVVPILMEGLRRLEYRGYDSAGIAVVNGSLKRLRSSGRVSALGDLVTRASLAGKIGIAHTRWATHGKPSEANAHPHVSGGISVVHNGIIENHEEMRARLKRMGYVFASETDSEVIAHLVHSHVRDGLGLLEAVRRSIRSTSAASSDLSAANAAASGRAESTDGPGEYQRHASRSGASSRTTPAPGCHRRSLPGGSE